MTRIKICGIRRKEDIDILNRLFPDFAGFVFAPGKRQVSAEKARELSERLHHRIKKVGVFVNEQQENLMEIAYMCGLDAVQLHGDESPEYTADILRYSKKDGIGFEVWKAIRIRDENSIKQIGEYSADAYLLDAFSKESYGGTGKGYDLKLVAGVSGRGRIILAGGLTPENVIDAIGKVRPFAVDTSSGVEKDGFKDEFKIKAFIKAVRENGNKQRAADGRQ
jgi:phosphoribosylanthranilate isomerase